MTAFLVRYAKRLTALLFTSADGASIAVFRAAFGAILVWEVVRYFQNGWIKRYFIDPQFHFSYYGFDWVKPLPGDAMYLYFAVLGILAACIAFGFCYRISITLFFVGFTYLFLCEEARWLNHFYLIILLSFLLIFIPAHRTFSIDAWLWARIRSRTVPTWAIWVLRAQIGLVYVFGGIAKLNLDWLRGQPMQMWLNDRSDLPLAGVFLTMPWIGLLFSYGGLLLDLSFVPLVLWQRTRPLALIIGLLFHLTNSQLFDIGIFPWLMIAANLLFLPPGWPRWIWRSAPKPPGTLGSSASIISSQPHRRLILTALGIYFAIQVLLPLRHFFYPGDVNWTQQGDRFSWRMKLLDIRGSVQFWMTDPTRQAIWVIDPTEYLSDWQIHEMIQRPDMVLQFSHYLAERYHE